MFKAAFRGKCTALRIFITEGKKEKNQALKEFTKQTKIIEKNRDDKTKSRIIFIQTLKQNITDKYAHSLSFKWTKL